MGEVDQTPFGRWAAFGPAEERLERLVRGLTYQDGWTFTLTRSGVGTPWLTVEWELDDVDEPGRRTLLAGGVEFRPEYGDDALRYFLFGVWEMIDRLEAHERLEQLRFDGEPIWDPHPPTRSRGGTLVCTPDHMAPLPELRESAAR